MKKLVVMLCVPLIILNTILALLLCMFSSSLSMILVRTTKRWINWCYTVYGIPTKPVE